MGLWQGRKSPSMFLGCRGSGRPCGRGMLGPSRPSSALMRFGKGWLVGLMQPTVTTNVAPCRFLFLGVCMSKHGCLCALSWLHFFVARVRSVQYPHLRVMEGSWRAVQLSPMWLAGWLFCVRAEFVPSIISSQLTTSCAALSIVIGLLQKKTSMTISV